VTTTTELMKRSDSRPTSELPTEEKEPTPLRRGFLFGSLIAASAAAGTAFASKQRVPIARVVAKTGGPYAETAKHILDRAEFSENAHRIIERQAMQNAEVVKHLKAKYEDPIFGQIRVWDLIQKLALCVDPTDVGMLLTNQYLHVMQTLEYMERENVQDRDLLLIALLHDAGKVMLLTDELPENIVGFTNRIGDYPAGAGLDNIVYQFGHGEMIYSRLKDHVPEHIAWTIRHHSTDFDDIQPFLTAKERQYLDRYLLPFRKYDNGSKSISHLPKVDMKKYREMIEDTFPQPILI
jgi:hypothetical protein